MSNTAIEGILTVDGQEYRVSKEAPAYRYVRASEFEASYFVYRRTLAGEDEIGSLERTRNAVGDLYTVPFPLRSHDRDLMVRIANAALAAGLAQ
jgi:hypothetical protein